MSAIPDSFLDAVVAIGFPSDDDVRWGATGFLFGRFIRPAGEGESLYETFLVTNRHVLDGEAEAVLRFNPLAAEPARHYRTSLLQADTHPQWVAHPNPSIDIAVISIDGNRLVSEGVNFKMFREDRDVLDKDGARRTGLAEGDPVFVIGFPMGLVGGSRSYVIVRQGIVARIRDWLADVSSEFLVDASIFPGSSGGPVVTGPVVRTVVGSPPPRDQAHLVGVVSGFLPWTDVAVSRQTGRARVTFEENSGLASIVPVDYVSATVDAYRLAHPASQPPSGHVTEEPPSEDRTVEPIP